MRSRPKFDATFAFAVAAVVPLAAIGIALVTQHVFGMQPCPWCVLQRVIFLAIALVALAGLVGATLRVRVLPVAAAAVMLALSGFGIAAAVWQHFVASASHSCNLTLADRVVSATGLDALWPEVFAPYASCADAAVTLLGVPYEHYSLTLFVGLAAAAIWLLWRRGA